MTPEQQTEAKRWFINRFIHSEPGRHFALRLHDLEFGARIQNRVRRKNARYDFAFRFNPSTAALEVVPYTRAADWASGQITLFGGVFIFTSHLIESELLK